MDPKQDLREAHLAKRKKISTTELHKASQQICARLFALEPFRLATAMGLYSAIAGEVETEAIFHKAHTNRKEIFYPVSDRKKNTLHYYRVNHLEELQTGFGKILEPSVRTHPLGNISYLDLVVVPGIAFDAKGNRLGFGKGLFDRFLKGYTGAKVALAFEWQLVEELPTTPRDEKMDWIVTEERVIRIT